MKFRELWPSIASSGVYVLCVSCVCVCHVCGAGDRCLGSLVLMNLMSNYLPRDMGRWGCGWEEREREPSREHGK